MLRSPNKCTHFIRFNTIYRENRGILKIQILNMLIYYYVNESLGNSMFNSLETTNLQYAAHKEAL